MSKENRFIKEIHSIKRERAFSAEYTLKEDLEFIRNEYGIRVRMGKFWELDKDYFTKPKKFNFQAANFFVGTIRTELEKYPPNIMKTTDMREIRLLKKFYDSVYGYNCAGMLSSEGIILGTENVSTTIHHELFHWVDRYFVNLSKGSELLDYLLLKNINEWKSYFPENSYIGSKCWDERLVSKGYMIRYAMKNYKEDRATTAEFLMDSPLITERIAERDEIIEQKIKLIKDFYYEKSDGLMDDQYFQDLKNGIVKRGYWQER
jgi:hypothetical protein